ncbi:Zinc knuckle CX2CX4HX4C [Sesbania bispinosa]|nr:Zinc knuckle CX2CX4HX4C [Sesbania bispinosa]
MDLGPNFYSIALTNERDRDHILKGCPWSFDKYIVAIEPLNEDVQPSEIDLHECPFWIRIYDLPLNCRTCKVARSIGENLGKFEEWDTTTKASMGTFLHIRVKIDLLKPLRLGMLVQLPNNKQMKVFLKYEKLLNFCYICGRLGHVIKTFPKVEGELDEGELESLPYGVWMRASPLRPSRMSKEDSIEDVTSVRKDEEKVDEIGQLERKLKDSERWDPSPDNIAKRKKLLEEYDEVLRLDELYWKQRSRALWLQEGDKITKFSTTKPP